MIHAIFTAILICLITSACAGSPSPTAASPTSAATPVGPKTTFGAGSYVVGTDIAPGRYYADPSIGCSFTRLLTLSRPPSEGPPWNGYSFSFDAGQWIVDIADTDREFQTNSACGTWVTTPVKGLQDDITPGIWLVGPQIAPGTYETNITQGCHWERLASFDRTGLSALIDGDIILATRLSVSVTILPTDAGFLSTPPCGRWRRSSQLSDGNRTTKGDAPNTGNTGVDARGARRSARGRRRKGCLIGNPSLSPIRPISSPRLHPYRNAVACRATVPTTAPSTRSYRAAVVPLNVSISCAQTSNDSTPTASCGPR